MLELGVGNPTLGTIHECIRLLTKPRVKTMNCLANGLIKFKSLEVEWRAVIVSLVIDQQFSKQVETWNHSLSSFSWLSLLYFENLIKEVRHHWCKEEKIRVARTESGETTELRPNKVDLDLDMQTY